MLCAHDGRRVSRLFKTEHCFCSSTTLIDTWYFYGPQWPRWSDAIPNLCWFRARFPLHCGACTSLPASRSRCSDVSGFAMNYVAVHVPFADNWSQLKLSVLHFEKGTSSFSPRCFDGFWFSCIVPSTMEEDWGGRFYMTCSSRHWL